MKSAIIVSIVWIAFCLSACKQETPVQADTQAPAVALRFPSDGAELALNTTCTISADADPHDVTSVEFFIDGTRVATRTTVPYEYRWTPAGSPEYHSILAKAYDASGNIGFSAVIAVHVTAANRPPLAVSNPSPSTGATGIGRAPVLQWKGADPDSNALTFDVFVGVTANPTTQVASELSLAQFTLSGLVRTTTYYWRVNSKDRKGAITLGPVWNFTTSDTINYPPDQPTGPSPADNSIITPTALSLTWTSTDPEGDAMTYDIYWGTRNTPSSKIVSGLTTASYTVTTLAGNTAYFWRVEAKDAKGNVSLGPVWSFVTGDPILASMMVPVAGGAFLMGDNTSPVPNEKPVHQVTLGSFFIENYEVTFNQWTEYRNWALSNGYTDLSPGSYGFNPIGKNPPLVSANWYDMVKWCNARSEREGLTPVYYTDSTLSSVYRTESIDLHANAVKWNANGYRLPTEAEWEFAARGGNRSHGYTYSGSNTLDDVAWASASRGTNLHQVGMLQPNELGLYDMSGNASEWCWDFYGPYSIDPQTDPKGAVTGTYRVERGGAVAMLMVAYYCRVVDRQLYGSPSQGNDRMGFRCVRGAGQ